MPSNFDLMREKRERLKVKRNRLRIEAKAIARDIPVLINPSLTDIEKMDVAGAASKMDELVMKQAELLGIQSQLWDLEDELGN